MKRAGFGVNVTKLAKPLVAASLEVYETIQKELLPTPTKSHYTFNLRDVSKVIQVGPLPGHSCCKSAAATLPLCFDLDASDSGLTFVTLA